MEPHPPHRSLSSPQEKNPELGDVFTIFDTSSDLPPNAMVYRNGPKKKKKSLGKNSLGAILT